MKIVVLDGYTLNPGDLSWNELNKMGDVKIYDRTAPGEIVERSKDAEIIFTNKVPVSKETIAQLPKLKYIGVLATGYNIIDTEAAKQKNIVVANVPGYSTASVVQLCFALLLELTHHVQRHSDAAREGKWARSADFCFWDSPLIELAGKTIGIIGFGTIGQGVADVATAFGMNIIAQSRTKTDQSHRKNFKWVELPELLAQSDVISIHCPLTPETKGLINEKNLGLMKKSAFLINTSRGPIINDEDLANALNKEVITGAGIDVLSVEPPKSGNPLFAAKNCLITPHIGWATKEARGRLMSITINNLQAYVSGKPVNVVNK
ncbi:MAG: D-2-hydroxyacid dehydrogenase [Chitinophagaceae bacterium]|nr:D-2-hydroxyacid dehydrogenase [Chitinophagaceae bacterium]